MLVLNVERERERESFTYFPVIYSHTLWSEKDISRTRAKPVLRGEKGTGKSGRREDSRFEYIFRDGLYVTPLSHGVAIAAGEVGVPQATIGSPPCSCRDVGTAPATPILERVDAVRHDARCPFSLRSLARNSPPSLFLSSLSFSHPLLYSRFSILIPSRRRARARLSLFLFLSLSLDALSVAFPFSRFRIRLSRTVAAMSLSFRDRVAHPIPSPCSRRRRPSPAGGRRTSVPLAHNPSTKRAIRNN